MAGVGRVEAIDQAVGREGFKIVLLLRLSPLFPFRPLNYALGLTRVRLGDYVLASWIGMLPGTMLYVYLGSLLTSATELARGAPTKRHEDIRRRMITYDSIEVCDNVRQRTRGHQTHAHGTLDHSSQEGRWHAMARNVGDVGNPAVICYWNDIEEIAADVTR